MAVTTAFDRRRKLWWKAFTRSLYRDLRLHYHRHTSAGSRTSTRHREPEDETSRLDQAVSLVCRPGDIARSSSRGSGDAPSKSLRPRDE